MKTIATLILSTGLCVSAIAQTTITNGGFESWGNTVPSGDTHVEPTNWYSNQSGSSTAAVGGETCFKDSLTVHSGMYSVMVQTITIPVLLTVVNGNVTTGVVNAPTLTKADGYIGTVNFSNSSDDRRMAFTGRPDSLVGWYQYTPGAVTENGKIRAILHTGDYYDPETPTRYHPACIANEIASALFYTDSGVTVSTWTRFSVPFTYVSTSSPAYIMINVTSSADQNTSATGSVLLLDDLSVIYGASANCDTVTGTTVTAITGTTATLSWAAVPGSADYAYAVNNSAGTPATSTLTTATSVSLTGLTAASLYYAHVLNLCSDTTQSAWVTKIFTTTGFTGFSNNVVANFSVTAFPNPVKDELTINVTGGNGNAQLQLMDLSGRIVNTMPVNSNVLNISMDGMSPGIYFIRYIDAARTQTIKVTKE